MIAASKLALWILAVILIAIGVVIQRHRLSNPAVRAQTYRTLTDWSSNLWTLFLLNGLLVGLLIYLITGDKATGAGYAGFMLRVGPDTDSWQIMSSAVEQLRMAPDVPLYTKLFYAEHIKFQYPPSSLVPFDLLQRLTGASWAMVYRLCDALSWCCVLLTGVISWWLLLESHRVTTGGQIGGESKRAVLIGMLSGAALAMTFYPLNKSYALGQVQTVMTFFAGLALLLWQRERTAAAGILIGLCCAIKPQWGAIIVWGILRRQWHMVIASTLTLLAITLIAVQMYGLRHYIDYLPVLSFLSMHGEAYHPNQSINGLMNRLLFNGNNLHFEENGFPPYNPLVYICSVLSALLIVGMALLYKMRQKPNVIDLALMMLSLTMASPIAWEHHYGILLPIFGLLGPIWLSKRPAPKPIVAYLLLAYFLTSQRFGFINRLADTHLNIFQSHLLFGAAMVLLMLYRTRQSMPPTWGSWRSPALAHSNP
jgi:hypothetical protein